MGSIFSKIVSGEIPSYKIAENEEFLAFLDAFPVVKGHVLVIPKEEVDYIFDMDTEKYLRFMAFAKSLEPGIKKTIPCKKVGIAVVGLEVPHAHIHLIPINEIADMDFTKKIMVAADEMAQIAEAIKANM